MSFETLIWIVPAAVLLAGAWRPRYGLVVVVATLPLFGSPPGGPYLGALDATALAAVLTSLRRPRPRGPGEPDRRRSGLEWPVGAWVTVSLVSMLPLVYRPPAWTWEALAGLALVFPETQSGMPLYTWRISDISWILGPILGTMSTWGGDGNALLG
jgi:hypothetical protein